ncbi:unnamed protein product [Trypanosoma congolense IL3000]|uniref:WGS project CAEQ00000000 data, annotated contig 284 n=1 Tax=Trypanosoma congolense (strain IL3000) TaxID=1068625 RepID=F9WEL0_TRYCI|nr:unnamed protein product [Trypanosoma congolense IL3000]
MSSGEERYLRLREAIAPKLKKDAAMEGAVDKLLRDAMGVLEGKVKGVSCSTLFDQEESALLEEINNDTRVVSSENVLQMPWEEESVSGVRYRCTVMSEDSCDSGWIRRDQPDNFNDILAKHLKKWKGQSVESEPKDFREGTRVVQGKRKRIDWVE